MAAKPTKLDKLLLKVMQELTEAMPANGFIVVSMGEKHGKDHLLTYSNLPDDEVQHVAALILDVGSVPEVSAPKDRKMLH
ncbi:hypothetical protein [Hyphomicrobium sp.]|uniref:hypothetical protein n=1 Tax=Hyphomicrobium sp. TaxID=82 RepID=UPI001DBDCC9D|nr:hypothetical protein [Hyphomicrobium sp.]MBY0559989.1 hypothetical protein [Hyphomicrobium sp.]